ncbi:MAG: hypothetical protein AAF639_15155 [Chloroflexota bacterium]
MQIKRFKNNPIIYPALDERMGDNINGPSLIRVPDWVVNPLGQYYLYFAHHDGQYIRLAYSDDLEGPWTVHSPGVLPKEASHFAGHIASPDVHVDHAQQRIRLYYHGSEIHTVAYASNQQTRVALSQDGLHFVARAETLGIAYFRVFQWDGHEYALAMPGLFYRSRDGLSNFEKGPMLFSMNMRHAALKLDGHMLTVFYTDVGDCPERILCATIDLRPDWHEWVVSDVEVMLEPELDYEGSNLPRVPSVRGISQEPVCELRDPAIFREDGRTYLLYCVAGERGIAMAELLE